jgi:hypothetical protein
MKKQLLLFYFFLVTIMSAFAQNIVISEIYYNAPNSGIDSLEYVELYNKGTTAQSLNKFTFKGAFTDELPNVELAAGAYYVVTSDSTFFKKAVQKSARQWTKGSLSNTGATIQLWSDSGTLVDSVRYRTAAPWPTTANGNGPSIELCDLNSNNDLGASWGAASTAIPYSLKNQNGQAVPLLGTPGAANKCATTGGGGGGGGTAPVIKDLTSQTAKNTAVNINIAQPNGLGGGGGGGGANAITSSGVVKPASNGTVTKPTGGGGGGGNNNSLTYTPNTGFVGMDKFDYFICTANGCDSATISVRVFEPTFNNSTIGKATAQTAVIGTSPDSLNRYVEFEGIVHSPNYGTSPAVQFTLIDAKFKADGIEVARASTVAGYTVKEGDRLRVRGRIAQNNNLNRIVADSFWVKASGVKLQEPTLVSTLDEGTENVLVSLSEVSIVDSTKWTTAGTTTNFFVVEVTPDNGATKYQVRIDKDLADLANWKAPKGKFDLVGIGFQGPTTQGGGGGGGGVIPSAPYQIMPRYIADFKFPLAANDALLGKAVSIFPNPFSDQLTVTMTEQMDILSLKDVLGREILKINKPNNTQIIETKDLQSGVYFINVQKNGRTFVSKTVKQ